MAHAGSARVTKAKAATIAPAPTNFGNPDCLVMTICPKCSLFVLYCAST